ncbi:hypothetical protein CCHL11_05631 [Colletotrichum chlorophyti]|uniref:Uncharacterized protein n=1 Tax=Colletotrichum chlorophyti TaxID=708187 RepID=A0A1Q8RU32_9PEZI|nr:hypothetical protein CCHL11_05631 [Colletotrichum chlorophyti]
MSAALASSTITSPASTATAASTGIPTAALTTTFTPPAQCTENHLTMLVGALEKIWINEPVPLPGSTISSCYPTQWLSGYTSIMSESSSIAPFISPLVCPSGWNTESSTWSSGYIACCAPGFTFAAPSKTADSDRPAYGGTCYSDFDLSQTATVTVYNPVELSTTIAWVATTTPAQAYAHPIDGIAADYTPGPTRTYSDGNSSPRIGSSTLDESSGPKQEGNSRAALVIGFLLASVLVW